MSPEPCAPWQPGKSPAVAKTTAGLCPPSTPQPRRFWVTDGWADRLGEDLRRGPPPEPSDSIWTRRMGRKAPSMPPLMKPPSLLAAWLAVILTAHISHSAPAPAAPNYASQMAAKLEPVRRVVYKTVGTTELHLDVFVPPEFRATDHRPAWVTIHGGGWTSGTPRSMYPWAEYCTTLGMVALSVQYRLHRPGGDVSVFDCVRDARSALRYIRAHAGELGIDPRRIVVNGASAGGHLAVGTALFEGLDEAGDDQTVSCRPDAIVLFSPVIDTSTAGYGNAKVGARWRELSPAHQVRAGLPPTIVFHGTGDTTTPFPGAQRFHEAMLGAGNRCELVRVESAQHTYMFKDADRYAETQRQLGSFLAALGFVEFAR